MMNVKSRNVAEQTLQKLTADWASAELQGDTAFLDHILTDDFVGTGPRGFMLSKDEWLQRITSGDLEYEQFSWDDVKVRNYGDAAIVTGKETQRLKYQDQVMENQLQAT